jgi:hypothetical protein
MVQAYANLALERRRWAHAGAAWRTALARLRYETFDESDNRIDDWQVRALVPTIGNGEGPVWCESLSAAMRRGTSTHRRPAPHAQRRASAAKRVAVTPRWA